MTDPVKISGEAARAVIVEMFRRDLIGPLPPDVIPLNL
jgi:hypothetical protein